MSTCNDHNGISMAAYYRGRLFRAQRTDIILEISLMRNISHQSSRHDNFGKIRQNSINKESAINIVAFLKRMALSIV